MNLENPVRLSAAHTCSIKITQDVREYAAQKKIDEQATFIEPKQLDRIDRIYKIEKGFR
jgi:hypothetical protein